MLGWIVATQPIELNSDSEPFNNLINQNLKIQIKTLICSKNVKSIKKLIIQRTDFNGVSV